MKLQGREQGALRMIWTDAPRRFVKGERKMVKARHRYARRTDRLNLKANPES